MGDPLRKKSTLLAIILQQRPERFLRVEPSERVPPIIDYHLQRSCLRTGLVRVRDAALREKLLAREDELGQLRKAEATLTNTLISTQNFSDQLKHNAQQEAERIVKEGELRAEQVVLQARAELAELHHSLADLRRQRIVALERIRATIRAFDRILELEENEQPAASPYDKEISLPPEETSYSPNG